MFITTETHTEVPQTQIMLIMTENNLLEWNGSDYVVKLNIRAICIKPNVLLYPVGKCLLHFFIQWTLQ